ncbi:glutamate 5-kinase [Candidatus Woesearchaeota archaeon]|nr:glutamate 5-kinase [Candidatus Woesearchaeota archaeon]
MMKKKLIVKIGTSTLTQGSNRISYGKIEDIARQIVLLKKDYNVILVSSGAIATAKQFVDINGFHKQVDSKQAMAAIGQPKLMRIYDEIFSSFGLKVSQCLMTYRDFENVAAKVNTQKTIIKLLEHDYIPIINENDTVAIEEIVFGDNDKLSALVASVIKADLLILVSDINGLYDQNPHLNKEAKFIKEVTDLKQVVSFAKEKKSDLGTGGMTSKIQAAEICKENNIEMWIVNGGKNNFLIDALHNKILFTKFRF